VPPANQPMELQDLRNRWWALYAQDQVSLLDDRLHVLVGGRLDQFHSEFKEDGVESPEVDESKFTWRAGALFEVTDWAAPYFSLSQSFNPQGASAIDAENNILPPEEGQQYEVGMKFDFFNETLMINSALFQIKKENVAVFDLPTFLDTGVIAFTSSDQRSRGFELDVTGQLTDEVQIIANYALTDTEVLSNLADPSLVGQRLGNVPEHAFRSQAAYNFGPASRLSGFGFGGSLRYESERVAQFDDTRLDSFITLDAGVWYRHELSDDRVLRAQLNFKNLTDTEFFPRASDQSIVHPGEPFSVIGTLSLEF